MMEELTVRTEAEYREIVFEGYNNLKKLKETQEKLDKALKELETSRSSAVKWWNEALHLRRELEKLREGAVKEKEGKVVIIPAYTRKRNGKLQHIPESKRHYK